ncbi:MAG: hypothetical protein ACJAZ2_002251 [Glaciecola sp.]|jgi:hypothetical protein
MKNAILAIILTLFLTNCDSQTQETKTKNQIEINKIENWKTTNYIDSVQILLTNEYQLNESRAHGASSFLILAKGDTVLCTAKHLLGDAMGISPEIKTEKFDSALVYWKAFPRNNLLSSDTIYSTKIITKQTDSVDIILQNCVHGMENNIIVLKPRLSKAAQGEKFEIIGCQYSDSECHQRKYYATMDSYEEGKMFLISETKFIVPGFSGAPVIDSNGLVIGVLSGGGELEGELYLAIEPFSKIETYLK